MIGQFVSWSVSEGESQRSVVRSGVVIRQLVSQSGAVVGWSVGRSVRGATQRSAGQSVRGGSQRSAGRSVRGGSQRSVVQSGVIVRGQLLVSLG